MMWRTYIPEHCRSSGFICSECAKAAIDAVFADITKQIDQFRADATLCDDDSIDGQLLNQYVKGNVEGYNNAVAHIRTMLIDMRECNQQ